MVIQQHRHVLTVLSWLVPAPVDEVFVSCSEDGRVLLECKAYGSEVDFLKPIDQMLKLDRKLDPKRTVAILTLHGLLYVKVFLHKDAQRAVARLRQEAETAAAAAAAEAEDPAEDPATAAAAAEPASEQGEPVTEPAEEPADNPNSPNSAEATASAPVV